MVVTVVLPLRSRDVLRHSLHDLVTSVGDLTTDATAILAGAATGNSALRRRARAVDAAYQASLAAAVPIRRHVTGRKNAEVRSSHYAALEDFSELTRRAPRRARCGRTSSSLLMASAGVVAATGIVAPRSASRLIGWILQAFAEPGAGTLPGAALRAADVQGHPAAQRDSELIPARRRRGARPVSSAR